MERGIMESWNHGPHLHPQNLGWKAVEGKLVPMQCDMDVAPNSLLKVVRCYCSIGCDPLRCSCPKAGLECSTGCGECRSICANMYESITARHISCHVV